MSLRAFSLVASLIAATPVALAHAPRMGANGGAQVDAGSFHVEVVSQGTTLAVFLRDHSDKAVPTEGYKGTAIFVIDGKPRHIPLLPAGENKLTGTSPVSIPNDPKGAVQITTPTGGTVQAKLN